MSNLDTLETVLTWEGEIDNARIRELLGVKTVWASRLMGQLVTLMGQRAGRSTAHAPLEFRESKPKRRSPDEYLQLISAGTGWPNTVIHDARRDLSHVSPRVFGILLQAIRRQRGVRIVYRSMSSPEGRERVVFPHAFVRAPRRWHVRAWCEQRQDYCDFNLGRIATAEAVDTDSLHPGSKDSAWTRMLEFRIVPHPDLTIEQQRMVAQEYFPGAMALRLRVREALAGYAIQDLRLARDPRIEKPPAYQLLVFDAHKLPALFSDC